MSTLYQNKIVKNPSKDYETGLSQKVSSTFSSKIQRFNYKVDRSPGPGSYQFRTSNYKLPEYHVQKNVDKSTPIKREYQWILGSDRGSYMGNLTTNYGLGPGTYNLSMQLSVGGTNTNWGKSQRFQTKDAHSTQSLPGPGSYQNRTAFNNKGVLSVFKSKSPRTFIQKLISQASIYDFRKPEIQQLINNPEIGNIKEKQHPKVYKSLKSSVFASRNPRFLEVKDINEKVGPGSYQIQPLNNSRSKEKLPKLVVVKDQEKKRKQIKGTTQIPGPGAYELNSKTIQKSLQQIGSIVIPTQPRFAQKYKKSPGPGSYMRSKNQYEQELMKKLRAKYSPQKPSFNSSSSRIAPQLPNKDNPLCNYNLQYYDLQYRVKKSQEHLQKLKIMQVTLPAFNSKAKR